MSSLTDLSKSIQEIDLKKLSKKNLIELVLEPTYRMNNAYNTTRSKWLTDLNVPNDLEELINKVRASQINITEQIDQTENVRQISKKKLVNSLNFSQMSILFIRRISIFRTYL